MEAARRLLGDLTVPRRLLLASALAYGGVFAGLLAYGRAGLGIGQGFYVPVILAAAATSPAVGALGGAGALFLYELAIHDRAGLAWSDFTHGSALTRLASYVAAGVLTGFLARRGRLMLAQSLHVLDELLEIAQARVEPQAIDGAPSGTET